MYMSGGSDDGEVVGADNTEITQRTVDTIVEHEGLIDSNKERIESAFEAGTTPKYADQIDQIGETLFWLFRRNIPDEDVDDLINALFNSVISFDTEVQSLLKEERVNDGLIDFFMEMRIEYSDDLTQAVNLRNQGKDWWNNVSTSVINRSGNHLLSHEFTKNMEETVTLTNRIAGSHNLARHLLNQTKSARNIIGDDALREADKQALEDIVETATKIIEDVEYLEEEDDEVNSEDEDTIQ